MVGKVYLLCSAIYRLRLYLQLWSIVLKYPQNPGSQTSDRTRHISNIVMCVSIRNTEKLFYVEMQGINKEKSNTKLKYRQQFSKCACLEFRVLHSNRETKIDCQCI